MQSYPYVNEASALRALEWERRFQCLPSTAGVIFVSVKACPETTGESSIYEVRLGISRKFEEATGTALVKHVLSEEINSGKCRVQVAIYRGSPGAACANHHEDAGPNPT